MAMISVLKGILFDCVRPKTIFSGSHRIIRNCSNTLKNVEKPFTISRTVQSSPGTIKVEFHDSTSAEFHYIWLRDNCICKKCFHPQSNQRLIDTASLDLNITPTFCHVTNTGKLKIVWPEGYNEHPSFYDPKWLHRFALGFENYAYEKFHDYLPPVKCWTGGTLAESFPEMEYEDLMQSLEAVDSLLKNIHEYGIQTIRNVPCESGEIIKIMNRVAHTKDTRWGSWFHITNDGLFSDPACLTHVKEKTVELHTDMDYLENSPGVQAVHCLGDGSDSGKNVNKSFFVDGFCVAEWLKTNHPTHFKTLTSIPVKFRLITRNMRYLNYQPVLKLNRWKEVTEVHFNNRVMTPLEGPPSSIRDFYAAYKAFSEFVHKPENQFRVTLHPGDVVILNNRRVLHGGCPYATKHATMHLEGCYADMDEFLALYRASVMKKFDKV